MRTLLLLVLGLALWRAAPPRPHLRRLRARPSAGADRRLAGGGRAAPTAPADTTRDPAGASGERAGRPGRSFPAGGRTRYLHPPTPAPPHTLFMSDFAQRVRDLGGYLDVERRRQRVQELNEMRLDPEFWNDPNAARKVEQEAALEKAWVDAYDRLVRRVEDIQTLEELAREEADADLGDEIARERERLARTSRSSSSRACSPAPTTSATPSSRSTRAPAAPRRRTGARCCCGCTPAGPSGRATRSRCWSTRRARRPASRARRSTSRVRSRTGT
jgi:hypothetical protein